MYIRILIALIAGVIFISPPLGVADRTDPQSQLQRLIKMNAPVVPAQVIQVYPHDAEAFTQGLFFYKGSLYESTGLYGRSALLQKEVKTGKTVREIKMGPQHFGEGAVGLNRKIYQLTWKNETLHVYDFMSFKLLKTLKYKGEGWGLATDGRHLLMSNGTSMITIRDPRTFKVIRKIKVTDGDNAVDRLNELEFINGEVWANIFMEDLIVRFNPENGKVRGWIDVSVLRSYLPVHARVDAINGIAYDESTGRVYVTGKLWPKLFEIKLFR